MDRILISSTVFKKDKKLSHNLRIKIKLRGVFKTLPHINDEAPS